MKRKHFYVLTGMKKEQIAVWKDDIREDLTFLERGELIIPIIELSWREAVKMKFQILCSNVVNHYGFGLVRI